MFNLVKKDFLLQKKSIYFVIGYGIFIFFAFQDAAFAGFKYIMGGSAISYILIMTAIAHEEKNNSDVILNSLPICRKTIVQARYLMILVSIIFTMVMMGLIGFVIYNAGFPPLDRLISVSDFLGVLLGVSFLSSVYYPLFIKFGGKYMRIFNIILFMIIFFLPSFLGGIIAENPENQVLQNLGDKINSITVPEFYCISLLISISMLLISYLISLKIYENKEF